MAQVPGASRKTNKVSKYLLRGGIFLVAPPLSSQGHTLPRSRDDVHRPTSVRYHYSRKLGYSSVLRLTLSAQTYTQLSRFSADQLLQDLACARTEILQVHNYSELLKGHFLKVGYICRSLSEGQAYTFKPALYKTLHCANAGELHKCTTIYSELLSGTEPQRLQIRRRKGTKCIISVSC